MATVRSAVISRSNGAPASISWIVRSSADGTLQVGNATVSTVNLVSAVKADLNDKEAPIRIKGDAGARYSAVIEVIDLLTRNGLTKLQFLTSRGRPGEEPRPD